MSRLARDARWRLAPPGRARETLPGRASLATAGRLLLIASVTASGAACSNGGDESSERERLDRALGSISAERLRDHVEILAAPGTEGRVPTSSGHRFARDYIIDRLADAGLEPAGSGGETYLHTYPTERNARYPGPYDRGQNLAAILRGVDPEVGHETVVVMAHYDHLGEALGAEYNGAYDDAAGVSLILEIARGLRSSGYRSKRSILFLLTDEEEYGLRGARGWVDHPTIPLDDVVFALSADPVGRPNAPGYMWTGIFGLEHSPDLEARIRADSATLSTEDVVVASRQVIDIFASDQDAFLDAGIPAAWFVNPGFSFYHQPTDTPETIDYAVLLEAVRVFAQVVDRVANETARYAFVTDPPIEIEAIRPYRRVFERFLEVEPPIGLLERSLIAAGFEAFDRVEARGFVDRQQDQPLFTLALGGVFVVSLLNPGPIPPAFPAGETAALP